MDRGVALLLTVVVGGAIAAQAPINSKLGHSIGTLEAASISFLCGTAILLLLVFVTGGGFGRLADGGLPWWYFVGGLLGAALVAVVLVTVRTLGAGGVTAGLISGQILTALVIDQFGWLGVDRDPITLARALGVALLAAGTYLVVAD